MKHPLMALTFAACLLAAPAFADRISIGFEGPEEGPAPTDLSENGFTITATDMSISSPKKSGDGTDGPNEVERRAGTDGYLTITRPGAPFQFVSLDWQSENATPAVQVLGYLNGDFVGSDSFVTLPGDFKTFLAENLAGLTLDRLIIRPQRDSGGAGALDAVVLDNAPDALRSSEVARRILAGG